MSTFSKPAMTTRPNPLPRFYVWLTYLLLGPLMLVLTAVCASTALLVSLLDKNGRVQHSIAHFWGRTFVRLSLSRLKIEGEENFHKHPVAVYVSTTRPTWIRRLSSAPCPFSSAFSQRKISGSGR